MFDKVFLVVVAAGAISILQGRLQLSQERLEKAKRLSEISVDKPISIVAELPAHLDAFILYAEHIRSHNVEQISSQRLTELQSTIGSDLEGSRAYYADDPHLKAWAMSIKDTITAVRAKALNKKSLGDPDLQELEAARDLAYKFHGRVINLSVEQALKRFDTAYGRDHTHLAP